ncbi:MAG: hypothetical protein IPL27_12560 [Lewinellaceae bacterium]|nr:hypothetical protein [Lewinellaceae bacterium]
MVFANVFEHAFRKGGFGKCGTDAAYHPSADAAQEAALALLLIAEVFQVLFRKISPLKDGRYR